MSVFPPLENPPSDAKPKSTGCLRIATRSTLPASLARLRRVRGWRDADSHQRAAGIFQLQLAPGQLDTRIDVPPVVPERRGRWPREDVEAVVLAHAVRVDVKEISTANRDLESENWREADFGVHETLPVVVLDIGAAVAVERRLVLAVIGVARHSVPRAARVLAGHGAPPRGSLLRDREQSTLVELVDQGCARTLELWRKRDVVLVWNRRAREVEDGVQAGRSSHRR